VSVQRTVKATWIVGALLVCNAVLRDVRVDWLADRESVHGHLQVLLTALFLLVWGVSVAKWWRAGSNGLGVPFWCKASISLAGILILAFCVAMMRFVLGR